MTPMKRLLSCATLLLAIAAAGVALAVLPATPAAAGTDGVTVHYSTGGAKTFRTFEHGRKVAVPGGAWTGDQTLPAELALKTFPEGVRLTRRRATSPRPGAPPPATRSTSVPQRRPTSPTRAT
jgi:hypothetical protein